MTDTHLAALAALRASTAALIAGVDHESWTDADVLAPSLLPSWSRGHVLSHIARNADSITRTVAGALRGDMVARYPNGPAGRDADIEAGASRGAAELLADVRNSADRLDRDFAAAADIDGWAFPTEARTIGEYVFARWREVEIHHVDLAGSYRPADWSPDFVAYLLPELLDGLSDRTPAAVRVVVEEAGSVVPGLANSLRVGEGDPIEVAGPDWAILAWLAGRAAAAADALSAAPPLDPWI